MIIPHLHDLDHTPLAQNTRNHHHTTSNLFIMSKQLECLNFFKNHIFLSIVILRFWSYVFMGAKAGEDFMAQLGMALGSRNRQVR